MIFITPQRNGSQGGVWADSVLKSGPDYPGQTQAEV